MARFFSFGRPDRADTLAADVDDALRGVSLETAATDPELVYGHRADPHVARRLAANATAGVDVVGFERHPGGHRMVLADGWTVDLAGAEAVPDGPGPWIVDDLVACGWALRLELRAGGRRAGRVDVNFDALRA